MLQKINRLEVGLFFLRKIQLHVFLNPPTYHFQLNFSKIFFLEILFRFDSDLKIIARLFESPVGTDLQPEILFQKISKFHPDFVTIS